MMNKDVKILFVLVSCINDVVKIHGIFDDESIKEHRNKRDYTCFIVPLSVYIEKGVELW